MDFMDPLFANMIIVRLESVNPIGEGETVMSSIVETMVTIWTSCGSNSETYPLFSQPLKLHFQVPTVEMKRASRYRSFHSRISLSGFCLFGELMSVEKFCNWTLSVNKVVNDKWASVMSCQISLPFNQILTVSLWISHVVLKQLVQPVFKANNAVICLTALVTPFAKGVSLPPPQFSSLWTESH